GLLAFAFVFIPLAYGLLRAGIVLVLLLAISFLILRERKMDRILWASFIFFISGCLGWVCLNRIPVMSTQDVFFPLFSGLFGLSTLLVGIQSGSKFYPQEKDSEIRISSKSLRKFSFLGAFGGLLVGLLPAVSPSQIGIFFQEVISLKEKTKEKLEDIRAREFITIVASLNTADAMFSIFALYLIGNPRSGVSVVIGQLFETIDLGLFAVLSLVMLISGSCAYFIHLWVGKRFALFAGRIDFQKLSMAAFVFVLLLIFSLTGFLGLAIAFVSLTVGLIPIYTGVSRTHTMGVLLLPALLFFLGYS
ncbi:MAG: tripartite tricarboxylate transporter permease, partial [Candidatus Altiarchaeota archaeon]|nr:tripartite tricarboxylate transporter permease [Candidatus Altiarchaeota archaeon]